MGLTAVMLATVPAGASAQPPAAPAPAGQPAAQDPWAEQAQPAPGAERRGLPGLGARSRIFVSPAGEVYRPEPGSQPFADWFRRADANGDGAITWDEFRADFARVFPTLDIDGDGEIEPEEVTRYETAFPEMSSTFGMTRGSRGFRRRGSDGGPAPNLDPGSAGGGGETGALPSAGRRGRAYSSSLTGAARFGLLPIPHPIMEADVNFNRGVTAAEWEQAARRRFTPLDTAHTGRLTAAGLLQGRMEALGLSPAPAGGGDRRRGDSRRPRVAPGAGGTPLPND